MQVVVDQFGFSVGKTSERLVVRNKERKPVQEVPFFDVDDLIIASRGVTLSSDIVQICTEHGIRIFFLDHRGDPYSMLVSPSLQATVATRRAQIAAFNDHRGVHISKLFITAKLRAQANLVKYWAKNRRDNQELQPLLLGAVKELEHKIAELQGIDGACIDDIRLKVMSAEGRGANAYWEIVKKLLPNALQFPGREHRGAEDPVNAALNYGYGCLRTEVTKAVLLAGLEECAGFLHVDRSGRPSFVLDFIEEFRQSVVDRTVVSMLTKGFTPVMGEEGLDRDSKAAISGAIRERLESKDRFEGKKVQIKTIIQRQANHLATYFRGEWEYKPFVWSW